MATTTASALEAAYIAEWGRSVAVLTRRTGDLQIAEDCVQDAFESALRAWERSGVPDDPGAWIRTAAWRRFIDGTRAAQTRRDAIARVKAVEEARAAESSLQTDAEVDGDELALLFLCAHPALKPTAQVMLMLRVVGGLTPREIAAAFFVEREAVRSRLLRAKRKVRDSHIGLAIPTPEELSTRLQQVLATIYLIYNEAYMSTQEDAAHRPELAVTALRLADRLVTLLPNETEVHGLFALLLLAEARLPSRSPDPGELVALRLQDRSAWRRDLITLANQQLTLAGRLGNPGSYSIQAAISALHCDAASADETDWISILGLYDRLLSLRDDPIVRLNRLIALAHVHGAAVALEEYELLDRLPSIANHHLLHATRGELARLAGDTHTAREAFAEAASRAENAAVQRSLLRSIDG